MILILGKSALSVPDTRFSRVSGSTLVISMIELNHQRSSANTSVNKMRLDIFVLFNILNYCRFASYSEFHFPVLIHVDES